MSEAGVILNSNEIRQRFAESMAEMYGNEVGLYNDLVRITQESNADFIRSHLSAAVDTGANPELANKISRIPVEELVRIHNAEVGQHELTQPEIDALIAAKTELEKETGPLERVDGERHGAIRLGSVDELASMVQVYEVMGMEPVEFYNLGAAGGAAPVISTAARPLDLEAGPEAPEEVVNPFRVFTSVLDIEALDWEHLKDEKKLQLMQQVAEAHDMQPEHEGRFSEAQLDFLETGAQQEVLRIQNRMRELVEERAIFPASSNEDGEQRVATPQESELQALITAFRKQDGLMPEQADRFVKLATRTFRMSDQLAPGVTVQDYEDMRNLSQVAADIVAFPNPHINHLTPRALDIQDVYDRMYEEGKEKNFAMLKQVQGPPTAMDPTVLLNQTSYVSKPTWVYTDIDQKHWLEDANTLASLASAVQAAELDGKPITLEYDASKPDLAKFGLALDNAGLNLELLFGDNNRAQITLQEVVDAIAANERISGFAFSEPVPEVDIIAHTARFGEIEQRGIALTREGRAVYDEALKEAAADYNKASAVWKLKEKGTELFKESIANMNDLFQAVATQPFRASGLWKDAQQIDPYAHLIEQKLAHFTYEVAAPEKLDNAISDKLMSQLEAGNGIYLPEAMQPLVDAGVVVRKPMVYEDFLPKSAAGIFKGNQAQASDELSSADIVVAVQDEKLKRFIDAGVEPYIAYNLYAAQEAQSVQRVLAELKEEQAVDVPQAVDAMLEQRIRGRNMRLAYEESAALETKHDEANLGFKRSA